MHETQCTAVSMLPFSMYLTVNHSTRFPDFTDPYIVIWLPKLARVQVHKEISLALFQSTVNFNVKF